MMEKTETGKEMDALKVVLTRDGDYLYAQVVIDEDIDDMYLLAAVIAVYREFLGDERLAELSKLALEYIAEEDEEDEEQGRVKE